MSVGHVDTTIKTAVQNNTVADAVLDAAAIFAWRNELASKIDGNYDAYAALATLLASVAPGSSGADNVASAPITGITGATVYAQLAFLKALLDLKAPITSPTFLTSAILPSNTTIGSVSPTELGCLDGVTSSIQTQLNSKTIASGTGSPKGVVTPTAAGQLYLDQTSGLNYVSNGITNTSWVVETQFSSMAQQAIINAAMEVWQQGTTFTNPTNNAYTADMWLTSFSTSGTLPTSIVHSQLPLSTGELFNSKYAYNINFNSAGSGFGVSDSYGVKQKIENGTSKLCGNGKKVTVSFYAKCGIGGKRLAVGLKQVYGTGGSPSGAEALTPTATTIRNLTDVTSQFVLYTFTFTTNTLTTKTFGTNNDDYLELAIYEMWGATFATDNLGGGSAETFVGAGSIAFTQVVVNAGDTTLPFQPKSFNDELISCLRYFEKSYSYPTAPLSITTAGMDIKILPSNTIVTNQIYGKVTYRVVKRVVPTVTIYPYTTPTNTGRVSDSNLNDLPANSGVITTPGDGSFGVVNTGGTITTVNNTVLFHWTSDARL